MGQPYFFSVFLEQFCEFQQISNHSLSKDLVIYFSILSLFSPLLLFHSRKYFLSNTLGGCLILGGFLINMLFTIQSSYASLFYSLFRLLFSILLPSYIEMILLNRYPDKPVKVLKMISLAYSLTPSVVPLVLSYCLKIVSVNLCMSFLSILSIVIGVITYYFVKIPPLQTAANNKETSCSPHTSLKIILYAGIMAFPSLLLSGYTFFRYSIVETLGSTREWENMAFTYSGILRMGVSFFCAQKLDQYKSLNGLCLSLAPIFVGTCFLCLIPGHLGLTLFYTGTACSLGILSILKGLVWSHCFSKNNLHKAKSIESFFVALFSNGSIFLFGHLPLSNP